MVQIILHRLTCRFVWKNSLSFQSRLTSFQRYRGLTFNGDSSDLQHTGNMFRSYSTGFSSNESNDNNSDPNADRHDPEILSIIRSYPLTSKNTTPYQILGFAKDGKDCKTHDLKNRFYKLAKIYHPDLKTYEGVNLTNKSIFNKFSGGDSNGGGNDKLVLTADIKTQRFKKILAAYTLLKHPRTRSNYDNYQIGWEDNASSFHRSPPPASYSSTSSQFTSNYNNRSGTWEDYYPRDKNYTGYQWTNDRSTWNQVDPNSSMYEQFKMNQKTIFLSVLLTTIIYTVLQISHIILYDDYIGGVYQESVHVATVKMNEKSETDLVNSYSNYGFGESKNDRVKRFLWWREISMLLNLGDLNVITKYLKKEKLVHDKDELRDYDRERLVKEAGAQPYLADKH